MLTTEICEHCAAMGTEWIPRGECGPWPTWMIATYIAANGAIFLAYWYITITLIWQCVRFRTYAVVGSSAVTIGFGAFIALCGTGHLEGPLAFVWPHYPTFTVWHVITAIVSVFVAITFPAGLKRYRAAIEENQEFRRHFGEVIHKLNGCRECQEAPQE